MVPISLCIRIMFRCPRSWVLAHDVLAFVSSCTFIAPSEFASSHLANIDDLLKFKPNACVILSPDPRRIVDFLL